MPTYEYTCRDCGHTFDIVQSMWDESLTMCPECGGSLRKVFAPPAISFKGSGFYATDHGKNSKSASESRDESRGEGEKKSEGDKKSEGQGSGDQKSDGQGSDRKKAGEGAKSSGSRESSGGSSAEGRSTPAKKEPAPS